MAGGRTPRAVKWASLPNSLELPYVEQGDETGSPAVFVHAYADSWRSFELVLDHIPRSIHAFAPTQRGHGDASRPVAGYAVEDFARDLEAFMDDVGLEQAVLVASSSATFTVQRFAIDNPHRTRGLVLIGVPWSLRDIAARSELARAVSALTDPVDPAFVRDFVASTVSGPVSPAFVETIIGESLKVPASVWQATLEGVQAATPPTESGTLTAPTLIVWGARDAFVPRADQEKLAAAIRDSQLVIYEGTGHVVHWEQPERVATDIAAFVRRLM